MTPRAARSWSRRLKALRAVSSAAQQAHQQAQGATAARARRCMQMLQQALAADVKAWRADISALASAAGEPAKPAPNLDEPMERHRELQLRIKQAIADCTQLQAQEKALAASLAALHELQARRLHARVRFSRSTSATRA